MNLAAIFDWDIESLDVENAHLEAPLDHEIYMNLPIKVKLNKCLYGLKQAGERWNNFINDVIQQLGFTRCIHDKCIYFYRKEETNIQCFISLFVDDILLYCNSTNYIDKIKKNISKHLTKLTSAGAVKKYIGIHIQRDRSKRLLTLERSRYSNDYISKEVPKNANPKLIPLPSTYRLQ
jgi:hypothetical protein